MVLQEVEQSRPGGRRRGPSNAQKCGVAELVKVNGSIAQTRRIVLSLKNGLYLGIVALSASHIRVGCFCPCNDPARGLLCRPAANDQHERNARSYTWGSRKPNVLP